MINKYQEIPDVISRILAAQSLNLSYMLNLQFAEHPNLNVITVDSSIDDPRTVLPIETNFMECNSETLEKIYEEGHRIPEHHRITPQILEYFK